MSARRVGVCAALPDGPENGARRCVCSTGMNIDLGSVITCNIGMMGYIMDENVQAKFEERLKELMAGAKKKKNVLEYQ